MTPVDSRFLLGGALALVLLGGCDTKDPGPQPTSRTSTYSGTPSATRDPDVAVLTVIAVDIDTKLAVMCGLPESKVFFKFDSAKLGPDAKERLQQIAACATSGAAKGKDLVAIGRTDPAGTDDYNKQLGMTRADAVVKYLQEQGVASARVEAESKGERTATQDPYGWPYERRVTVRLQP